MAQRDDSSYPAAGCCTTALSSATCMLALMHIRMYDGSDAVAYATRYEGQGEKCVVQRRFYAVAGRDVLLLCSVQVPGLVFAWLLQ
jgi:hypothetical protein